MYVLDIYQLSVVLLLFYYHTTLPLQNPIKCVELIALKRKLSL